MMYDPITTLTAAGGFWLLLVGGFCVTYVYNEVAPQLRRIWNSWTIKRRVRRTFRDSWHPAARG